MIFPPISYEIIPSKRCYIYSNMDFPKCNRFFKKSLVYFWEAQATIHEDVHSKRRWRCGTYAGMPGNA
jgi:hypothetical protein